MARFRLAQAKITRITRTSETQRTGTIENLSEVYRKKKLGTYKRNLVRITVTLLLAPAEGWGFFGSPSLCRVQTFLGDPKKSPIGDFR